MKAKVNIWVVSTIMTLLSLSASAEVGGGGEAGAFLQLAWSARAAAMGGAFVAVADDAEGGLINPAGTVLLQKRHFTASYRKMTLDRKLSFVSYAQSLKDRDAGLSISWINLGVSDIEERDANGEVTGDIRYYENFLALTFGKRVAKQFFLGINIKYDQSSLADISANGLGFDFGFLWGENRPYKLGFSVQNIGLNLRWTTGDYWQNSGLPGSNIKDKFPVLARIGGAAKLPHYPILLALDLEKKEKQDLIIHAGAEGWVNQNLALRAGYGRKSFSFGAGIKYAWQNAIVKVNYAYNAGTSDLGGDNLLSVAFEF